MSYVGLGERKTYICNPYKNSKCERKICGIMNNDKIDCPGRCFVTTRAEFALLPSDPDLEKYRFCRDRMERWVKEYYGKESHIHGGEEWKQDTDSET